MNPVIVKAGVIGRLDHVQDDSLGEMAGWVTLASTYTNVAQTGPNPLREQKACALIN